MDAATGSFFALVQPPECVCVLNVSVCVYVCVFLGSFRIIILSLFYFIKQILLFSFYRLFSFLLFWRLEVEEGPVKGALPWRLLVRIPEHSRTPLTEWPRPFHCSSAPITASESVTSQNDVNSRL